MSVHTSLIVPKVAIGGCMIFRLKSTNIMTYGLAVRTLRIALHGAGRKGPLSFASYTDSRFALRGQRSPILTLNFGLPRLAVMEGGQFIQLNIMSALRFQPFCKENATAIGGKQFSELQPTWHKSNYGHLQASGRVDRGRHKKNPLYEFKIAR